MKSEKRAECPNSLTVIAKDLMREAIVEGEHVLPQSAYQLSAEDKRVHSCDDTHSEIMQLIRTGNVRKTCAELRPHIRSTKDTAIRASQHGDDHAT